jgi:hypothetical protein
MLAASISEDILAFVDQERGVRSHDAITHTERDDLVQQFAVLTVQADLFD